MTRMTVKGSSHEIQAGIAISEAAESCGIRPDAYIFLVDGRPVPMDSMVPEDGEVRAVRVASGGRSLAGYPLNLFEIEPA